jgi:hypothetical protein
MDLKIQIELFLLCNRVFANVEHFPSYSIFNLYAGPNYRFAESLFCQKNCNRFI